MRNNPGRTAQISEVSRVHSARDRAPAVALPRAVWPGGATVGRGYEGLGRGRITRTGKGSRCVAGMTNFAGLRVWGVPFPTPYRLVLRVRSRNQSVARGTERWSAVGPRASESGIS